MSEGSSSPGAPPKPSIGRIVTYQPPNLEWPARAAVIASVAGEKPEDFADGDVVDLVVFDTASVGGTYVAFNAREHRGSGPREGNTWAWPERV